MRFMAVLSIFPHNAGKTPHNSRHFLTCPSSLLRAGLRPLDPEGPLAKTIISAEPGALMKVAGVKGIRSFKSLSEKIGSDRKTLRAINEGRPVKETTLQTIADRLHVPLSHLCKDDMDAMRDVDRRWSPLFESEQPREIKLQPLNAKLLRELIESADVVSEEVEGPFGSEKRDVLGIDWDLRVDQITNHVEAQLLSFEKFVQEWGLALHGGGAGRGLKDQVAKVRMATEVEKHFKDLSEANIRIFGGSYLRWSYSIFSESYWFQSRVRGVVAIELKTVTSSKTFIDPGPEPPPSFENINVAPEIRLLCVNGNKVYERSPATIQKERDAQALKELRESNAKGLKKLSDSTKNKNKSRSEDGDA